VKTIGSTQGKDFLKVKVAEPLTVKRSLNQQRLSAGKPLQAALISLEKESIFHF